MYELCDDCGHDYHRHQQRDNDNTCPESSTVCPLPLLSNVRGNHIEEKPGDVGEHSTVCLGKETEADSVCLSGWFGHNKPVTSSLSRSIIYDPRVVLQQEDIMRSHNTLSGNIHGNRTSSVMIVVAPR